MSKINYQSMSKAGSLVNEDISYCSEKISWVLDAATGLTKEKLTKGASDGQWFVERWNGYLRENLINLEEDIENIIRKGISRIREEFYEEISRNHVDSIERPSASIAVIRVIGTKVEYFLLGDCTLLIRSCDGKTIKIKDKSVEKLDNEAKEAMVKIREKNKLTFSEARRLINPRLIDNRSLKNTSNGYWILGFEEKALRHTITGELEIESVRDIAIMSDGYASIFDLYSYCEEENFFNFIDENGIEKTYEIIRNIEKDDNQMIKYPRFKKSDDASIVLLNFE